MKDKPTGGADVFGGSASLTRQVTERLWTLRETDEAQAAFHQWREGIQARSEHLPSATPRRTQMLKAMTRRLRQPLASPEDIDLALFILESWYGWGLLAMALEALDIGAGETTADTLNGTLAAQAGVDNLHAPTWMRWLVTVQDPQLAAHLTETRAALGEQAPQHAPGIRDHAQRLHRDLIPREVRHGRGAYYTPEWLAQFVLKRLQADGRPLGRVCDPTCGAGVFLLAALGEAPSKADLKNVVGMDIDPLAVLAAKANLLMALRSSPNTSTEHAPLSLPVHQVNALDPDAKERAGAGVRTVVGNPPWVGWEALSSAFREETLVHWRRYGLFVHRGMDAILGKGRKDLSSLITLAAADTLLDDGGRMGMVLTRSLFKGAGAAEGFRRLQLPDGSPLGVVSVDSLESASVFEGASTRPVVLVVDRGRTTRWPVPWRRWPRPPHTEDASAVEEVAEPVDPNRLESSWLTVTPEWLAPIRAVLGPSDYRAHEGLNSGGANGVFHLEVLGRPAPGHVRVRNRAKVGKREVPVVEALVEEELVRPLLRPGDITPFMATPSRHVLMVQDVVRRRGIAPETMAERYPLASAFLAQFEPILRDRAAFRRFYANAGAPYWSMFNAGPYTEAPWKVVWARVGPRADAAVIPREIIPQETVTLVPCHSEDEAWFVAGLFNSPLAQTALRAFSQTGGKSFGSPHVLQHIAIPAFNKEDTAHQHMREVAQHLGRMRQEDLSPLVEPSVGIWSTRTKDAGQLQT